MLAGNRSAFFSVVVCCLLCIAGCNRTDTPGAGQAKPASAPATGSKGQAEVKGEQPAPAEWIAMSRAWPDTLRWDFDSAAEHRQDGLLMRLNLRAAQDFIPGQFNDTHPLQCLLHMTLRPIPQWQVARGLIIDSVVFYDSLHQKTFPGLPLSPAERTYESGTVRTSYLTIMKKPYTPTLTEGQPLQPTVYLHWDKRMIIATMQPVLVEFLRTDEKPSGM